MSNVSIGQYAPVNSYSYIISLSMYVFIVNRIHHYSSVYVVNIVNASSSKSNEDRIVK